MSEISQLAKQLTEHINQAGILPCQAEFRAYFKQDIEKLKGDLFCYVCPHSEVWDIENRRDFTNELTIDVALQKKLLNQTPEDCVIDLGVLADKVAKFVYGKKIGPYMWIKTEYYPYHGESLEQIRTFVSIVSIKYIGYTKYTRRGELEWLSLQ